VMGFWASKTLMSAVELGVFGALATGPLNTDSLRRRLGVHERAARDFFDALVALGLLQRDQAGLYCNSPEAAQFLDPAGTGYIGGIIEMFNARLYGFWGTLTDGLRTGEPQNEAKSGGDLFANLYTDPARLEGFLRGMTGITSPVADRWSTRFPGRRRTAFLISDQHKVVFRSGSRWPTHTLKQVGSISRRWNQSFPVSSPTMVLGSACASCLETSLTTICRQRTCW
jgi:Dimerisation domain